MQLLLNELVVRLREGITDAEVVIVVALAVVAVVALIVGAAVFILRMYTPRGRVRLLLESRQPAKARNPWPARIVMLLVAALVVVGTTVWAESPETCVSCHAEEVYTEALAETPHASVRCMSCHRSTGATARIDDGVRYSWWLWAYYTIGTRVEPGDGAHVDPRRCRSCHGAVAEGVLESASIRVQHSDFLDEGMQCLLCHGDVAHAGVRGVRTQPVMNQCLRCHNDEDASAACETCHIQDLGIRAVEARGGRMATVGIRDTGNCYRCHDPQPCTSCHGAIMPHPQGWNPVPPPDYRERRWLPGQGVGTGIDPGLHAREGFADREACWRCHHDEGRIFQPPTSCVCHPVFGDVHGGQAWVREHGLQATGQKTGTLADCQPCHGRAEEFCGYCHPSDYAARYAPREGPDNYIPSQPRTPVEDVLR